MPRRKTPRNPSYRRHQPGGQAVVTLNGRDFYLGRHDSKASRREYDRLTGEWLANGRRLSTTINNTPDITVSELIASYWRHCTVYYRKSSAQRNMRRSLE